MTGLFHVTSALNRDSILANGREGRKPFGWAWRVMATALGAERASMCSPEHVAIVARLIAKSS
jgi:hypothetical protein